MIKVKEEFQVGKNNIGWINSDFTREYGEEEIIPGKNLVGQKLSRTMTDSEIISEFKVQECTLGDILATINAAPEDMKDGYSNIFYIKGHPSRVVDVYWGDGEWFVRVWNRGDGDWYEGDRVFTPATGAGILSAGALTPLALPIYCECERCPKCKKLLV